MADFPLYETRSGRMLDPFDLDPRLVEIGDIAYGLARVARFGGQTDYCVAEHSLEVAALLKELWCCGPRMQLAGLMHDAHEYVLGDLSRPVKQRLPGYIEACDRAQAAIDEALDLPLLGADGAMVKSADNVSMLMEGAALPSRGAGWVNVTPMEREWAKDDATVKVRRDVNDEIVRRAHAQVCRLRDAAEIMFLHAFYRLKEEVSRA